MRVNALRDPGLADRELTAPALCGLAQTPEPTRVSDVVAVHMLTPAPDTFSLLNQACPCARTVDARPSSSLWFVIAVLWCVRGPAEIQNAATKC